MSVWIGIVGVDGGCDLSSWWSTDSRFRFRFGVRSQVYEMYLMFQLNLFDY